MWPSCGLKSALLETIGLQPSDGKGPRPLLWAVSRAASRKLTVSGVPHRLNYCAIFIVHTEFRNVVAGRIIQPGEPLVGDPCLKGLTEAQMHLTKVMTSGFASNIKNYIMVKRKEMAFLLMCLY